MTEPASVAALLRVGGVPEHFNLPWHVAIEAGDIAIDWRDYAAGTGAMLADLSAHELDLAIVLTEGAAFGIERGQAIVPLSLYTASPLIWGVHVPGDAAAASIDTLRGARFAISRYGSGSHLMSLALAIENRWPIDELRFEVVDDMPGAIGAFRDGRAGVFLWEHFTTQPLVDDGTFRRVGDFRAPWPAWTVCANRLSAARHRDAIDALLAVVAEHARRLAESEDAVELIAARYGLREAAVAEWLASTQWSEPGTPPGEALDRARSMLRTAGVV